MLVIVPDLDGHGDKADGRGQVHGREQRFGQIHPGPCLAGATVKNSRDLRMVVEEQRHVDRVADVDKIALLATVLVIGPV